MLGVRIICLGLIAWAQGNLADTVGPTSKALSNSAVPISVQPVPPFQLHTFADFQAVDPARLGFKAPINTFVHKDTLKYFDATPVADATDPAMPTDPVRFVADGNVGGLLVQPELEEAYEVPNSYEIVEEEHSATATKTYEIPNAFEIFEEEEVETGSVHSVNMPAKASGGLDGADEIEEKHSGDHVGDAAVLEAFKVFAMKEYARNCRVFKQRSEADCRGTGSTCWAPGRFDQVCGGGGTCCYDGCANVCQERDPGQDEELLPAEDYALPLASADNFAEVSTACVLTFVTKEEEREVEVCESVEVAKCVDEQKQECPETPDFCKGRDIKFQAYNVTEKVCKLVLEEQCHAVTRNVCEDPVAQTNVPNRCGTEKQGCEPVTKKECDVVIEEKCEDVEVEVGEPYIDSVCNTIETTKCTQAPKTECTTVPEEVTKTEHVNECEDETGEECAEEIETTCDYVKHNVCAPFAQNVAREVPVDVCQDVPEKKCATELVEVCHGNKFDSYSTIECKNIPRTVCKVVSKNKCRTELQEQVFVETVNHCGEKLEKVCRDEPKEVCKAVVKQVCKDVPVEKTETVSKEVCREVQATACEQVPDTVCHDVTKYQTIVNVEHVCRKIPIEKCSEVTTEDCRGEPEICAATETVEQSCHKVTEDVCRPVPVYKCFDETREELRELPHEVCHPVCKQVTVEKCSEAPEEQCRTEVKVVSYTVPTAACRK